MKCPHCHSIIDYVYANDYVQLEPHEKGWEKVYQEDGAHMCPKCDLQIDTDKLHSQIYGSEKKN